MVKKVAQRAIAAGLAGMMSLGAFAPAAMAIDGTTWTTLPWWSLSPTSDDDGLTFWKRIKGDTRYDTMKKILEACYTSDSRWVNAAEAVICSGDNWPDALAANGLAGTLNQGKGAPVILTKKGALSSQAKEVLEKMQVQHVYIMGGTNTVSQDVENAIAKMKIATTRVAGADRQETSQKAFDLVSGNWYKNYGTHSVIIATGANYADALSIAPFAYQTGTPIVLTKADGSLTQAQIDSIKDNEEIYNIIVVGGDKSVNASAFGLVGSFNDKWGFNYTGVRIDGADRYETSANIADWEVNFAKGAYNKITGKEQGGSTLAYNTGVAFTTIGDCYFDWDFTFVATGENYPDALAGAQLAGGSYWNARGTGFIAHSNKQGDKENFISGSPILLTKDGDRTAEMVISKSLAWNAQKYYKSAHALYANWFDLNKAYGTTPGDFVANYLSLGFFTDGVLVNGIKNTLDLYSDWYGGVESTATYRIVGTDGTNYGYLVWNGSKYICVDYYGNYVGDMTDSTNAVVTSGNPTNIKKLLRSGTTTGVDITLATLTTDLAVKADDSSVIYGTIEPNGDVYWFGEYRGKVAKATDGKYYYTPAGGSAIQINAGTGATPVYPTGYYVYGDGVFALRAKDADATGVIRVVNYRGDKGTYNGTNGTVTIGTNTYKLAINSPERTRADLVNASTNIYVFDKGVDAKSNFHGIIFGGTASVSKDKAKELDKAVKNSIWSDKSAWEWKLGDDYNTILNRSLLGNEFYAYRAGTPETPTGELLTEYYAPAVTTATRAGYWGVKKSSTTTPKEAKVFPTISAANAAGYDVEGVSYTMDFYHYSYFLDPSIKGVDARTYATNNYYADWSYVDTISVNFIVNENTGEIISMPQF